MRDASAGRQYLRPLPEEDDLSFWRDATPEQRGVALVGLLRLVDAIGHFPPKGEEFNGFPPPSQQHRSMDA